MRGKLTLAIAMCTLVFGMSTASAALLSITGGEVATIAHPPAGNDVLGGPLDPGITDPGAVGYTSGANLSALAGAVLTYDYIGAEAGFGNTFEAPVGTTVFTNTDFIDQPDVTTGPELGGLVNFKFTTGGSAGEVVNGFNPDYASGDENYLMAYLNESYEISSTATNWVVILFDDTGAGPDDNHDDLALLVHAVPIPAAVWLFGSALLGLVGFSRKNKVSVAA